MELADSEAPDVDAYLISSSYLEAMQITVVKGRRFSKEDTRGAASVALVSESCARYFGAGGPLGKHIQIGERGDSSWATVVGVVADVRQHSLEVGSNPAVYLPFSQSAYVQEWASLAVRSSLPLGRVQNSVRQIIRTVDPLQPIFHDQPMEGYVVKALANRILTLYITGAFGILSLLLASVGIYSVMSCLANIRRQEIGIRMAVGAQATAIIGMMFGAAARVAGIGVAVGGIFSGVVGCLFPQLFAGFYFSDLVRAGALSITVVIFAAVIAAFLPAVHASREDPLVVLRAG